jgi:hypothetical protein
MAWVTTSGYVQALGRRLLCGQIDSCSQLLERHKLQGCVVCAFQDDGGRNACVKRFFPTQCTQAPTVTSPQAGEPVRRPGCDEVVAPLQGKVQKCLRDFGADDMTPLVLMVSPAAPVPEKSGQWVIGARNQRRAQHIENSFIHGVRPAGSLVDCL